MTFSKFFTWLITFVLITGVGLIIGFFVLTLSGNIEGREFSPDNFSIRTFKYNKVPYLNWIITKKTVDDESGALQQDLMDLGFLSANANATTWHLVSELNLSESLLPPDPDLAPLFWPHVIEMARQESYLKIPEIMEFALTDCPKNPTEFSDELNTLVAQAYLDLGKIDYHLGRLERAKVRLQLSLDAESSVEAQTLLGDASNPGVKEMAQ